MKLDTSTDPQVGFRPPGQLDMASALERYSGPFSVRHGAHLLRRAGFGGTPAEIAGYASIGMSAAVDSLIHPQQSDLAFADFPQSDDLYGKAALNKTQMWWLDRMLRTKHPLVEKMTLFWHGHFATSARKVPIQLMARQIDLFRGQALGNFRQLLLAVSRDPAMLVWLDNRYNYKAHPNENYAREVMELFVLGLGNYAEADVKEAARAFTGWTLDKNLAFIYRPELHDEGIKTVLGHTGSFNGEDLVNIVVSQPASTRYIAHKLLEFFVYSDPEPELIDATASVYALSGYDIAKTVGTLLRSNVFYSQRAYRALPKSPIEYAMGVLRYIGAPQVPANLPYHLSRMGQEPLAPPSVKGWDGGPTWINTSTLLARFNFVNSLLATRGENSVINPETLVQAAGGMNAQAVLNLVVAQAIQDDLTSQVRQTLGEYLQSAGSSNPVPFGYENYQDKVRGLVSLVLNLPVNQLN